MTLKRQLERFFFICSVFITPLAIYLHLMNDGYNLEKPHHVSLILLALLSVYIIHNCQYKKKCSFWKTIKFYLITYKRIKNWYATIIIISLILIPYFVVRYTHDVPEFTLKYLIYIALFICAIIYPFTFFSTQFHKIWHETNTLFNNIKFYYSKTSNDKINTIHNTDSTSSPSERKSKNEYDERMYNGQGQAIEPLDEFWPVLKKIRVEEFTEVEINALKKEKPTVKTTVVNKVLKGIDGKMLAYDNKKEKKCKLSASKVRQILGYKDAYFKYRDKWLFD